MLGDKVTMRGSRRKGALPKPSLAQLTPTPQVTAIDDQPPNEEGERGIERQVSYTHRLYVVTGERKKECRNI